MKSSCLAIMIVGLVLASTFLNALEVDELTVNESLVISQATWSVSNNVVGHWHLNEDAANTTVTDSSSEGNTGTLSGGGFDPARDIAGITVNRWSHGYSYWPNPFTDPKYEDGQYPFEIGRKRFGRIAIANSDAAGRPIMDAAIDQAYRAIGELTG